MDLTLSVHPYNVHCLDRRAIESSTRFLYLLEAPESTPEVRVVLCGWSWFYYLGKPKRRNSGQRLSSSDSPVRPMDGRHVTVPRPVNPSVKVVLPWAPRH